MDQKCNTNSHCPSASLGPLHSSVDGYFNRHPKYYQYSGRYNKLSSESSADADALETLLFRDDQLTDEYVEYAHTTLEDYMFGGYLTKSEIDSGLKISDVLKNVKKEDLESPMSSPSPTAASSPSPSGPPVAERDLLRFIYQGLDSNVSLK